jgi:hypothetical protein
VSGGKAEAVRGLTADEALVDGEAIVFRPDGRSDFHALLARRGQSVLPRSWLTTFCVSTATICACANRRAAKRAAPARRRQWNPVQRNAGRQGRGRICQACELDLEGIVEEGELQLCGKSRNWLKIVVIADAK